MSDIEKVAMDVVKATRIIEMLRLERDDVAQNLVPIDIRVAQEEVRAEYDTKILWWEAELESAREEAKTLVLAAEQTVKVDGLQIQFVKGSEGWDGKKLEKLIDALRLVGSDMADKIDACRKPAGEPSVRFKFKEEK